jgi:hypothetical protein
MKKSLILEYTINKNSSLKELLNDINIYCVDALIPKASILNIHIELPDNIICKHEPKLIEGSGYGVTLMLERNICRYYGVELQATWTEKK